MAEALKNNYNRAYLKNLAQCFSKTHPSFSSQKFISDVMDKSWKNLELKERMTQICEKIHNHLPGPYSKNIEILLKVAPPFGGFEGMFFPQYVEFYGMKNYKLSLKALKTLTQYSSSEFAVRPFIIEKTEETMAWMQKLSKDKNYHVRRFASEGCRPRLPWAQALPEFKKNPQMILPILDNLKDDSELYVRKSVANNINDISKDNPDVALDLVEKWSSQNPSLHTQWIIKHGLRSLIKDGNSRALKLLGYSYSPKIQLKTFSISKKKVKLGESFELELEISNSAKKSMNLMVDYIVHHKKKNGHSTPKVFKLTAKPIGGSSEIRISKKHSFKKINTRQYHSGEHAIEIQINGKVLGRQSFQLST